MNGERFVKATPISLDDEGELTRKQIRLIREYLALVREQYANEPRVIAEVQFAIRRREKKGKRDNGLA